MNQLTNSTVTAIMPLQQQHGFTVRSGFAPPMTQEGSMLQQHGFVVRSEGLPPGQEGHIAMQHAFAKRPRHLAQVDRGKWGDDMPQGSDARSQQVGFKGLLRLSEGASWSPDSVVPLCPLSGSLEVVGTRHSKPGVRRLVKAVVGGLRACQEPEAPSEGLGGTYFFSDEAGRKVGIMKPCDEEPMAPNNPKGFVGRQLGEPGLKPTVRVGEAAIREVAAFLLDHEGFASVPNTVLVRMSHPIFHQASSGVGAAFQPSGRWPGSLGSIVSCSYASDVSSCTQVSASQGFLRSSPPADAPSKLGSLQEYVAHDCDTSEIGASRFSIRDVHRIGILDLRLFNTDRHAGNMLVRHQNRSSSGTITAMARLNEQRLDLIPIDHGFCLPETLEPLYVEWLHWPQAMIPFGEEELAYIARLDAAADIQLLRQELPALRDECLCTLEVATALLKACAQAGLCLAEIGAVVSRPLVGLEEEPSALEKMCWSARAEVNQLMFVDSYTLDDVDDLDEDEAEDTCFSVEAPNPWDQLPAQHSAHGAEGWLTRHFSASRDMDRMGSTGDAMKSASLSSVLPADLVTAERSMSRGSVSMETHSDVSASNATSPYAGGLGVAHGWPTAAAPALPAPVSTMARGAHGEDLLFALDEDGGSPPAHVHPPSPLTPVGFGALAKTPFGGVTRGEGAAWGPFPADPHAVADESDGGKGFPDPRLRSPASLAATSNMYLRPAKTARPAVKAPRPASQRKKGAAYPPKVAGAPPTANTSVFSGLMGEAWPMFMASLQRQIQAAIEDGRWRQPQLGKPTFGMSCPRF